MKASTTFILLWFLGWTSNSSHGHCSCNSEVTGPPDPRTLINAAQQVTSILLTSIPGTPGIPHQLAMVLGAMFDALTFSNGEAQLTGTRPLVTLGLSPDQFVAYAGYAALRRVFSDTNPDKVNLLDMEMERIGFANEKARDEVGDAFARAVALRFPLSSPPRRFKAPNPPSKTPVDATCSSIKDPDGWQALCIPSATGTCTPQQIPLFPLVNATLISRDGARKVDELISTIPAPPTYKRPLQKLPFDENAGIFKRQYLRVLSRSRNLNDLDKTVAEVFEPNAALAAHNLALDEAVTRGLDLFDSMVLLFAVSAGVRDALVGTSTIKLKYATIRTITLIQCAYRERRISAWAGPYMGVQSFVNSKSMPWRPYLPTPPHPGYVSGHTTVGGAVTQVLRGFFKSDKPRASNCFIRKRGTSVREPRISKGQAGYISGITDVPNKGVRSKGFVPARKVTVCWNNWTEYAHLMARSRLTGGVHTPLEDSFGIKVGRKAGREALAFVKMTVGGK